MANGQVVSPGSKPLGLSWRVLGSPAPVFPGFEVDICDRVPDDQKPDAVWHRDRAKEMIRAHPEIKQLIGQTRSTALWCVAVAGAQVGMAIACAWLPWWGLVLAAWLVGAVLNIDLFMLAHECNHSLVFKRTAPNRWLYTLTTLPMFLSGHHTWWVEHHVHHNDLGAKKDFIKRRRSFFLATRLTSPLVVPYSLFMLVMQALRSTLGICLYVLTCLPRGRLTPSDLVLKIVADEHLVSGYKKYDIRGWGVAYAALSLALPVTLFVVLGWKPVLYLLLAQAFMTGFLHPFLFGMILSNSHFHGHCVYQPSSSYYRWFNKLTFNFGLHTEHHDLAGIPWDRLPELRRIAPEFYDPLVKTNSYSALAMKFVLGRQADFEASFDNENHRNAELFSRKVSGV